MILTTSYMYIHPLTWTDCHSLPEEAYILKETRVCCCTHEQKIIIFDLTLFYTYFNLYP